MATFDATRYFLNRWRYYIGYGLLGFVLTAVLFFAGLYVPGGLSTQEMESVVASQAIRYDSFQSLPVVHLPYHLLQDGLLHLFGASTFTIKLASLIFALISALGLIALLRRWFRPNIAVLASLIAITTGQFLYIAQLGTPDIMFVFWPVIILLLGTQITRQKRLRGLWKFLFGASVALSLYSPLGIYTVITVVLTVIFHPHLRAAFRRLSRPMVALSIVSSLAILAPLAIGLWYTPSAAIELLGIPQQWPNWSENFRLIVEQYFIFWQPSATTLMTPVFGLGTFLLIALGFYRLLRTLDTTRSYLIVIWSLFLIPIIIFTPTLTSTGFVASVLLLAAGLTSLIMYWYRLFPRNPYARVAGMVPVIVLVVTLIGSGLTRYVYGYHYSPVAAATFSRDLRLLPGDTKQLIVSDSVRPFYQAIAGYTPGLEVITGQPTAEQVVVAGDALRPIKGYSIEQIITDTRSESADRFYVYRKQ